MNSHTSLALNLLLFLSSGLVFAAESAKAEGESLQQQVEETLVKSLERVVESEDQRQRGDVQKAAALERNQYAPNRKVQTIKKSAKKLGKGVTTKKVQTIKKKAKKLGKGAANGKLAKAAQQGKSKNVQKFMRLEQQLPRQKDGKNMQLLQRSPSGQRQQGKQTGEAVHPQGSVDSDDSEADDNYSNSDDDDEDIVGEGDDEDKDLNGGDDDDRYDDEDQDQDKDTYDGDDDDDSDATDDDVDSDDYEDTDDDGNYDDSNTNLNGASNSGGSGNEADKDLSSDDSDDQGSGSEDQPGGADDNGWHRIWHHKVTPSQHGGQPGNRYPERTHGGDEGTQNDGNDSGRYPGRTRGSDEGTQNDGNDASGAPPPRPPPSRYPGHTHGDDHGTESDGNDGNSPPPPGRDSGDTRGSDDGNYNDEDDNGASRKGGPDNDDTYGDSNDEEDEGGVDNEEGDDDDSNGDMSGSEVDQDQDNADDTDGSESDEPKARWTTSDEDDSEEDDSDDDNSDIDNGDLDDKSGQSEGDNHGPEEDVPTTTTAEGWHNTLAAQGETSQPPNVDLKSTAQPTPVDLKSNAQPPHVDVKDTERPASQASATTTAADWWDSVFSTTPSPDPNSVQLSVQRSTSRHSKKKAPYRGRLESELAHLQAQVGRAAKRTLANKARGRHGSNNYKKLKAIKAALKRQQSKLQQRHEAILRRNQDADMRHKKTDQDSLSGAHDALAKDISRLGSGSLRVADLSRIVTNVAEQVDTLLKVEESIKKDGSMNEKLKLLEAKGNAQTAELKSLRKGLQRAVLQDSTANDRIAQLEGENEAKEEEMELMREEFVEKSNTKEKVPSGSHNQKRQRNSLMEVHTKTIATPKSKANVTSNATAKFTANATSNATAIVAKRPKPHSMQDDVNDEFHKGKKEDTTPTPGSIWHGNRHSDPPTAQSAHDSGIHPTRAFIEMSATLSKKPHHRNSKRANVARSKKALLRAKKTKKAVAQDSKKPPSAASASDLVKHDHAGESTSAGKEGTEKHREHHKKLVHQPGKSRLVRAEPHRAQQ